MTGPSPSQRYDEAVQHHQAGRLAEATTLLCEVIADDPRHAEALHRLGLLTFQAGSPEQAIVLIEHAIGIAQGNATFFFSLATVQLSLGQAEAAIASYRRTIALEPAYFPALANLATTLNNLGRPAEALPISRQAVLLSPGSVEARNLLGLTLTALGQFEEAEAEFHQAMLLAPESIDGLINLGNLCFASERYDDAASFCRRAIMADPANAGAHSNLAGSLRMLGQFAEALEHYDLAMELGDSSALTRLNRSFVLLALGRFAEGWDAYEVRLAMGAAETLSAPAWRGEDLNGRSILLRAEQGFGDAIQFCRYAAPLAALGAIVTISAPRPLARLLASAPGVSAVVESIGNQSVFDYSLPMMSAPLRLSTTLDTVPTAIPYLSAPASAVAYWRAALQTLPGAKIGLVWAGEPRNLADSHRSIRLAEFEPILAIPGVSFISLQKGAPAIAEIGLLPSALRPLDVMDQCTDFADTAALIENLDLVITVDTAVAHLAGALGKPVWVLHRLGGCWRWLLDRTDSPWYPTARLFRQERRGHWADVVAAIAAELENLLKEKRQRQ